ncbi:MAG: TlpA disulfide reductase family protein, partial [Longimicrobiales bacterium]
MKSYRFSLLPLLALVNLACEAPPERVSIRALQAGDTAPKFAAVTLAGDTVSLSALRGRAVLLNVWATWCIPCRDEMPALETLHRERANDGLRVVSVSIDAAGMESD